MMPLMPHFVAAYCGPRGVSRKAAPDPMSTRQVSSRSGDGEVPFCFMK